MRRDLLVDPRQGGPDAGVAGRALAGSDRATPDPGSPRDYARNGAAGTCSVGTTQEMEMKP